VIARPSDISSPPRIETARLVLDAHRMDDFGALAAMWADPDVVRQISGEPSSREQSWSRLLRYAGLWPLLGFGYWAVREKQTGRFVGDIGFADFHRIIEPPIVGLPEAGWVLAGWAHGRGFATEALGASLAWLDRNQIHRRVVCLIADDHRASFRVAEKNGFLPAGAVTAGFENSSLLSRER
jgi:RimJ/RimL family protein N-acetyltransferase